MEGKFVQGNLFPEIGCVSKQPKRTSKMKNQYRKFQEEIKEQRQQIEQLKKENAALKFKAEAFDELLTSQSLFPLGVIAKNYGRTAVWLNKYLEGKGVQYHRGDIWMLYSKYDRCGYTRVCWFNYSTDTKGRPLSRPHTYWTSKGMMFIRELLIKDGLFED